MALQTVDFTSNTTWTPPARAYILSVFLVGGGGGGGYNGGSGGGGGRIKYTTGYTVTPGTGITVAIGQPGTAGNATTQPGGVGGTTTFGALSVTGGSGGFNGGFTSGTQTSVDYLGTITSYASGLGNGDSGPGGAGTGGNGYASAGGSPVGTLPGTTRGGAGGIGFNFQGAFYGGGGGGGCGTFTQSTTRIIVGGEGGEGGGGKGGGELAAGTSGTNATGGGGGGGARSGTTVQRTATGGQPNPGAGYIAAAAQNGGAGGTGFIRIQYDEAEVVLTTSNPGVAEGNSIIVYFKTRNIPNGTVLSYALSGGGITAADFNPATLTGTVTISSTDGGITGSASVTLTVATDAGYTEYEETVTVTASNPVTSLATTTFKIGDLYQNAVGTTTDTVGYLVVGRSYTISTTGTTDFTLLGSANSTPGTTFTATATGLYTVGNLVSGKTYRILTQGNTDFTKLGSASNSVGTSFVANGSGFINATAMVSGQKYTIITSGDTDFTAVGAGWVDVGVFQLGEFYTIKDLGTTTNTQWNAIAGTSAVVYTVGSTFTAATVGINPSTGLAYGTGSALPENFLAFPGLTFTAKAAGTGTGTVMPAATVGITGAGAINGSNLYDQGTVTLGSGTVSGTWVSKTIQIADYNNIQTKVAGILGAGTGNSGYGQTVLSNQVSTSSKVSVSDWSNLKYDIINAYYHQVGTLPGLANISIGDTVKANNTTSPYTQYNQWADVVVTQKFNIASTQSLTRSAPDGGGLWYTETAWPGALGATWTGRIYSLIQVSWPSASAARYFFNSGGEIRVSISRTGGTSSGAIAAQNASWSALLTSMGQQGFGGNKPIQDTGTLNGGNFYRLSNGFSAWYTATSTNPYSTNTVNVYARTPGVLDNSAGTASLIEFQVELLDNHTALGGATEGVDGTVRVTMSTLEASGTLQPSGSGTFQIVSPTMIFSTPPTT